jgi:RNA polymerase sigma-70 factor (ECF subfamily)
MRARRISSEKTQSSVDYLFRRKAGQIVASLTRTLGIENLQLAEDAVQDAFVTALRRWPFNGVPDNPVGWLTTVARNRALDRLRRSSLHRTKTAAITHGLSAEAPPISDVSFTQEVEDDLLQMIFACCHPTLSLDDQVALTLKTVGGLSVAEIAQAFLAKPSTVAQRLVRAKKRLRDAKASFELPPPQELPARQSAVLGVLYLLLSEGHSATSGLDGVRSDLCHQAIYLAELVAEHPTLGTPSADALASLALLQASRLPARVDSCGDLQLLAVQDRSRWDHSLIRRGLDRLNRSARGDEITTYHLQAEIAAHHALAASWEATEWPSILDCYDRLIAMNGSPVSAIHRLVVVAEIHGSAHALHQLEALEWGPELDRYLPAWVTRAELLRGVGRMPEAATALRRALSLGPSLPVQRLLVLKLAETLEATPTKLPSVPS